MITRQNIQNILNEIESISLEEWEFLSEVIKSSFKTKTLDYQRQLTIKDLNRNSMRAHIEKNLFGNNLDE